MEHLVCDIARAFGMCLRCKVGIVLFSLHEAFQMFSESKPAKNLLCSAVHVAFSEVTMQVVGNFL